MIYQHATRDRDQAIAKALGAWCNRCGRPPSTTLAEKLESTGCGPCVARIWLLGNRNARTQARPPGLTCGFGVERAKVRAKGIEPS
jgi:hypothetical protein